MGHLQLLPNDAQLPAALESAARAAEAFARASHAASTWRAYEGDWRIFAGWCARHSLESLPATGSTVAMFLAAEATDGKSPSTLARRLAAIRLVHRSAQLPSPHDAVEVSTVLQGIRRSWKSPPARKAPVLDDEVQRLVDAVEPRTAKGLRDRALLLLGFAGALRRSELVALNLNDITERDEGLNVSIRQSKTDQEGEGVELAIPRVLDSPYCPVRATRDWLVVAGVQEGAVFRRMLRGDRIGKERLTAQSVALVIKELALRVGLDPARYSGHSLRSGFLTSAARQRASIFKMAEQSRHRSLDVLRSYVRDEARFDDHAGAGLLRSRNVED